MGRGQKHRVNQDKNRLTLPQTPAEWKRPSIDGEELEVAKAVDDHYSLKARPGLPPTEVERHDPKPRS